MRGREGERESKKEREKIEREIERERRERERGRERATEPVSYSYLRYKRQTDEEIERKKAGDEDFSVSPKYWELVRQGSNDGLRAAKLEEIKTN